MYNLTKYSFKEHEVISFIFCEVYKQFFIFKLTTIVFLFIKFDKRFYI